MFDFDDFDDLFKRIERAMDGSGTSYMRKNTEDRFSSRSSRDDSEILIWDNKITITLDVSRADIDEIEVQAEPGKIYIRGSNVDKTYSRAFMLPRDVIPESLKKTYINGILDIELEIDDNHEYGRNYEGIEREGFSESESE